MFLALTEGDNRNVMAAQLAVEALGARRVIAKINDPLRATAYAELGIATVCRTGLMLDAMNAYLGLPASGLPGLLPPSGHHAGRRSASRRGRAAPSGGAVDRRHREPAPPTRRSERCSCSSSVAGRSATTWPRN